MLPAPLKAEISEMTKEIERLEHEQTRRALLIQEILAPHLTTLENCKEALDIVPQGYNTYKVRMAMLEAE